MAVQEATQKAYRFTGMTTSTPLASLWDKTSLPLGAVRIVISQIIAIINLVSLGLWKMAGMKLTSEQTIHRKRCTNMALCPYLN